MTQQEWLASRDSEPLQELLRKKVSDRRWRWFVCRCCRRVWHVVTDERSRRAVEMSEVYADGGVSDDEMTAARRAAYTAWYEIATGDLHGRADNAAAGAFMTANTEHIRFLGIVWHFVRAAADQEAEKAGQAEIFRDIFGNPFRPVAFDPSWLTSDVVALARGIYDERAFDRMPILADALQDAGCDNDDILNHCRDEKQVHARGCWVVDLVLGKQ